MPDVNGKKFPYTSAGKAAAKVYANRKGLKVKSKKKKFSMKEEKAEGEKDMKNPTAAEEKLENE